MLNGTRKQECFLFCPFPYYHFFQLETEMLNDKEYAFNIEFAQNISVPKFRVKYNDLS